MLALLNASKIALAKGKKQFTSVDLQQALTKITGTHAIQGVSGQIAFDSNGNPISKLVLVLCVDQDGHIHLDEVHGRFVARGPVENRVHLSSECRAS